MKPSRPLAKGWSSEGGLMRPMVDFGSLGGEGEKGTDLFIHMV